MSRSRSSTVETLRRRLTRSPVHAAAGLALLVALLVAATSAIGLLGPDRRPVAAPPPAATATAVPVPAAPAKVPPAALAAADRWARAWTVRPGQSAAQWIERLRHSSTPEFLGVLETEGDPAAAAQSVTGPPAGVSAEPGSAVVTVPTDLSTLRLELVDTGADGWRVAAAGDSGAAP